MTPKTLISAIGLILALAVPAAQAPTPLAIALVRADGILVPLAVFENGTWTEAWPEPADGTKLDAMIASLPNYWRKKQTQVPEAWHLLRRGISPVRTNVLTPVLFDEHCGHQVGLLTDLPARKADSHVKRIAADRPVPSEVPVDLSASPKARAGWEDLIEAARSEILRQESVAISNWEAEWKAKSQLEPTARRAPVRIPTLYAYRANGIRVLYYQGERRYAVPISNTPRADRSELVASGWIHASDGATPKAIRVRAVITDRDRQTTLTMVPLGVVRAGERTFWISQDHGYESEAVSLHEITPSGLRQVFSKFIGGC